MTTERSKLNKLKNSLIGVEMQLDLIERDLMIANQNIDYLKKVKADLLANIKILKQEKIISIASEYKKTKEELVLADNNINYYEQLKKTLDEKNEIERKAYSNYYKEYKDLEKCIENRKVILIFDPDKRKGKKGSNEG